MDKAIHRLEKKLYGDAPFESEVEQLVLERVLDDSFSRRQRLEDLDLGKPEVGESEPTPASLTCGRVVMGPCENRTVCDGAM